MIANVKEINNDDDDDNNNNNNNNNDNNNNNNNNNKNNNNNNNKTVLKHFAKIRKKTNAPKSLLQYSCWLQDWKIIERKLQ